LRWNCTSSTPASTTSGAGCRKRNDAGERGNVALTREHLEEYARSFQAPDDAELASFDPPA
jgi:hypothetical protein